MSDLVYFESCHYNVDIYFGTYYAYTYFGTALVESVLSPEGQLVIRIPCVLNRKQLRAKLPNLFFRGGYNLT